ncbi:MAG: hypothetical protein AAFX02_03780 [Pseudomonadota bacterium]
MSKSKKTATRAGNLSRRFARLKAAIELVDTSLVDYAEKRAAEFETLASDLAIQTTEETEETVN